MAGYILFKSLSTNAEVARSVDLDPSFDNTNTSLGLQGQIPYTPQNTYKDPNGSRTSYQENTKDLTQLQKHIAFFDGDCDGIIWPQDVFYGFRSLNFGYILSLLAVVIITGPFSYPTLPRKGNRLTDWLPDPFMRIYVGNIHRCKHGSDTESFDRRGRFHAKQFHAILADYSSRYKKDALSWADALAMLKERRDLLDLFGIFAFLFEWSTTYMLLWPADGYMKRDDILAVLDGSIFPAMAHRIRQGQRDGAFVKKYD